MNRSIKLPIWFFAVGLLATAWNGLGVVAFVAETMLTSEQLTKLPEAQQAFYESRPIWALVAFGIAVFAGLLGSLSLLTKKSFSVTLFAASLLGLIGQNTYHFFIAKVQNTMPSNTFIMPAVVFTVAVALLFFSHSCSQKGWLN